MIRALALLLCVTLPGAAVAAVPLCHGATGVVALEVGSVAPCTGVLMPAVEALAGVRCRDAELPRCIADRDYLRRALSLSDGGRDALRERCARSLPVTSPAPVPVTAAPWWRSTPAVVVWVVAAAASGWLIRDRLRWRSQ